MVYLKSKALVISKKLYKESDNIITVLSERYGKIRLIAKGANSHKSTRNSSLSLGNVVSIDFNKNYDFYYLSDIKSDISFIKTKKTLNQIKFLFYFLEILTYLIPEEETNNDVFNISIKTVQAIEKKSFTTFLACLINLLNHLGYGISPKIKQLYYLKDFNACFTHLNTYVE